MSYDPKDYTWPARTCEPIEPEHLVVGDLIWLRHPDGFNPWFQPLRVDAVTPATRGVHLTVSQLGTDGVTLYSLARDKWGDRRYVAPDAQVYAIELADRDD